jgi:hypothetical protein
LRSLRVALKAERIAPKRLSKIACFPSREFPEKPDENLHLLTDFMDPKGGIPCIFAGIQGI